VRVAPELSLKSLRIQDLPKYQQCLPRCVALKIHTTDYISVMFAGYRCVNSGYQRHFSASTGLTIAA
jgi:hypothetical protein